MIPRLAKQNKMQRFTDNTHWAKGRKGDFLLWDHPKSNSEHRRSSRLSSKTLKTGDVALRGTWRHQKFWQHLSRCICAFLCCGFPHLSSWNVLECHQPLDLHLQVSEPLCRPGRGNQSGVSSPGGSCRHLWLPRESWKESFPCQGQGKG